MFACILTKTSNVFQYVSRHAGVLLFITTIVELFCTDPGTLRERVGRTRAKKATDDH